MEDLLDLLCLENVKGIFLSEQTKSIDQECLLWEIEEST